MVLRQICMFHVEMSYFKVQLCRFWLWCHRGGSARKSCSIGIGGLSMPNFNSMPAFPNQLCLFNFLYKKKWAAKFLGFKTFSSASKLFNKCILLSVIICPATTLKFHFLQFLSEAVLLRCSFGFKTIYIENHYCWNKGAANYSRN